MNDISKDKDYQEFLACTEVAFGTVKGLLGYGICARCKKQAPVVRGASSEAFGVKNRRFWYRSDIWYRKPPSPVRSRYSVRRTASCGTRCIFRGPGHAAAPCGTEYARGAKNRLLWYATHFQVPPVRR